MWHPSARGWAARWRSYSAHQRPPLARQVCAGVSQPTRPGRGDSTVGQLAHAGGCCGGAGTRPTVVAPRGLVAAGRTLRRYHRNALFRRNSLSIAASSS
ncbi:hypothetical protein [Salinispora cortesiana]|uniref:hypothetical protein n=1 Tax=Salinispora cortesiana TaxID=1305843 RepID=UPI00046FB273|nr:hypothetical protein [Salinispora cortesiana]